eukprot:jgi/Antlo1/349/2238
MKLDTKERNKPQKVLIDEPRNGKTAKEMGKKNPLVPADNTLRIDTLEKEHKSSGAPATSVPRVTSPSKCAAEKAQGHSKAETTLDRKEHAIMKMEEKSTENNMSLHTLYLRYLYWTKAALTKYKGESNIDTHKKETSPLVTTETCMLQRKARETKACIETQNIEMNKIDLFAKEKISKAADAKLSERARRSTICGGMTEKTSVEKGWRRFSFALSIGSYFSAKSRKS